MKKNNPKKRAFREGFTLIELLISIVIFVLFLGVVSSSYVNIVRAQKQANEIRKMYSDVRGAVDMMAEEIRLGTVDYDCYYGTAKDNSCLPEVANSLTGGRSAYLALVRKDGLEKTVFHYDGSTLTISKQFRNAAGWAPAPGYEDGFRNLLSDRVQLTYLSFAIFPDVNPYSEDNYYKNEKQFQPKVTIFMTAENSEMVKSEFKLNFQTTISSRVYSRTI